MPGGASGGGQAEVRFAAAAALKSEKGDKRD
jgi:hypothetical protein